LRHLRWRDLQIEGHARPPNGDGDDAVEIIVPMDFD
jgi:hypothetical protein